MIQQIYRVFHVSSGPSFSHENRSKTRTPYDLVSLTVLNSVVRVTDSEVRGRRLSLQYLLYLFRPIGDSSRGKARLGKVSRNSVDNL